MSKWRPVPLNCLYVIPDIHGCYEQLKLICDRILPLRKSDGGKDKLIFLGDYIDRGPNTPATVDFLIKIKEKYKDQVVFLRGNHEEMVLMTLGLIENDSDPFAESAYSMWINNGGSVALAQYLESQWGDKETNPFTLPRARISDLIPKSHQQFMLETVPYYEHENYIFVHGGCNPNAPLVEQNQHALIWDRSMYETVKHLLSQGLELPWDKTVITGHNYTGPFINEKFMMLDCSRDRKLLVAEMNSMEGFTASGGKDKLVKIALNETVVKKSVIRRAKS